MSRTGRGVRPQTRKRFLRGLLYLPDGRRFGPTHATKGTRRYPYYFVAADIASCAEPVRLPAIELERTVVEAVRGFLKNPLRLSAHFSALHVRDTQRLLASAQEKGIRLSDVATSASRVLVRSLLRRVMIQDGKLTVEIERSSLEKDLLDGELAGTPIILTVPFEIRRRGRQVRLVISGSHTETEPVSSLIRAVAMARDWAERIGAGEIFELNQLASEYGIERSYAQKVLRCVALSPQLIETILSGQHEPGLTFAAATASIPLQLQLQA